MPARQYDLAGGTRIAHPVDLAVWRDQPALAAFLNERDGQGMHAATFAPPDGQQIGGAIFYAGIQRGHCEFIEEPAREAQLILPRHFSITLSLLAAL